MKLFTIGHSNHPIDQFISLLKNQGVEMLIDVRSTPYSRYNPRFNRESLQLVLNSIQIGYVYSGDSLGGRPRDPTCYVHLVIPSKPSQYLHELNYAEVMRRPWFTEGIRKLLEIAEQQTCCILCSEEDPSRCHRHHLIATYLLRQYPGVEIFHIRGDGSMRDARSIQDTGANSDVGQLQF